MTNIFTNPELFRLINEYTDLRSICDTCSLLSTLKKYINYILNKEYSLMYYDDISFRNIVLHHRTFKTAQIYNYIYSIYYIIFIRISRILLIGII